MRLAQPVSESQISGSGFVETLFGGGSAPKMGGHHFFLSFFLSERGRFLGTFARTIAYDSRIKSSNSVFRKTSKRWRSTHLYLPTYGAGMMSSRSTSSANFSGVHLKQSLGGRESTARMAKIFLPTLKQRSSPHCRFSSAAGNERQKRRMKSTFISVPSLWDSFRAHSTRRCRAGFSHGVPSQLNLADHTCSRCSLASPKVTVTSIFFFAR
jgi:hypothetical protein